MMMTSPFLLIIAYVCMTYAAKPYNCKKYECVEYELIDTKDKYEIRRYPRYNIATHSATAMSFQQGKYSNFMPLFSYIRRKNNDKGEEIKMTIPVFSGVEMKTVDGKRARTNNYKMTFFMPSEMTNPPTPLDNNVKMDTFGPVTAYVKTFDGWATEDLVFEYQQELREALIADNVQIDDTMFYVAEFNSPWQLLNRHNELIYLAA